MLIELTVSQFAIIQNLKVEFKKGLNILTGETGAGKSIIIDAIQLITGGRGSVEFIRSNEEKATIEALFDLLENHQVFQVLEENGLPPSEDGILILKRELLRNGKSVCRVNGQLVTLAILREVGDYLIQLHSQHQHQNLLFSDKQLFLLDAYGDRQIESKLAAFRLIYQEFDALKKEVKKLIDNEKEMNQRIDLLKYQSDEIAKAKLQVNEDDILAKQRNKIRYAEKISTNLTNAYQILNNEEGVIDSLSNVVRILEQVSSLDQDLGKLVEQISQAFYQIEDASSQLSEQVNKIEFDADQINHVEERLSLINHLKRKYGDSVNAILEYEKGIAEELNILMNRDETLHKKQEHLDKLTTIAREKAVELSHVRKEYAGELSNAIERELKNLQMKNAQFMVELTYEEDIEGIEIDGKRFHLTHEGLDKINFLISPNPGEPLKPLQKIVSGGELSRIMLAIQTILASKDDIPTIIFDEIDTGVSGRAAQAIAEKLAIVAKDKQVFVVTHLPQAASMADHHYLIQKKIDNNNTYTEIEYLDEEKRIDELARMLGGVEVTALTKKHAKEMIEKTVPFKNYIYNNF